jgi:hypothetical protein
MKYQYLAYRGLFGFTLNEKVNKKLRKADNLICLYNDKINTFETEEENIFFADNINKRIELLLK